MRALAPDPDHRFPTMQALQVALEGFAREASLPVSTVALGGLMQRLFADELAAWHEAQRAGKSLGEHLAARPVTIPSGDPGERTATDAFGPTRRRATARAEVGPRARPDRLRRRVRAGGRPGGQEMDGRHRARAPVGTGCRDGVRPGRAPPSSAEAKSPAPTKILAAAVVPAPGATAPTRVRHAKHARVETPTPAPAPASRLRTWDPDSPKPP